MVYPESFCFSLEQLRICLCHNREHLLCLGVSSSVAVISSTFRALTLLLVLSSWHSVLLLFPVFTFQSHLFTRSPLLGSLFLPASLRVPRYLLNLCSPCHSFSSLSAFPSRPAETADSTEETRRADVYPALCCHKLFTSVYRAKALELTKNERGAAKIAKKNCISLKILSRFGSDVVWFFVKRALWS